MKKECLYQKYTQCLTSTKMIEEIIIIILINSFYMPKLKKLSVAIACPRGGGHFGRGPSYFGIS